MERLTKEQAFQLHNEFENIDDTLLDTYIGEDVLLGSEKSESYGYSD